MSDVFGRMIARATGHAPLVRAAAPPRFAIGPTREPMAVAPLQAEPGSATELTAAPAIVAPARTEHRAPPSSAVTPAEPRAIGMAHAPPVAPERAAVETPLVPVAPSITAPAVREVTRIERVAVSSEDREAPAITVLEALVANPQHAPDGPHPVPPRPRTPELREIANVREVPDRESTSTVATPARRSPTPAAALPRVELREALAVVGRALSAPAQPAPRTQAQPQVAREDIHITIGQIDVHAATPPAPAARAPRREPSVSLDQWLRRPPGARR